MKKQWMMILIAGMLALTGCQDKAAEAAEEKQELAEENKSEESAALEEILGDYIITPNDALKTVFSKSWNVTGTEDVYVLEMDGTGTKNGEAITYECGFDQENKIVLSLIIGENKTSYFASADATGYGLDLSPVAEGEEMNLFPSNLRVLLVSDERAEGLVGTWEDENKNAYVFENDGTLLIKGKEADTPGRWCALEKIEEGVVIVNLLVEGGSLEFEYEIQDEGKTLELYNRGMEAWYYWYRS